MRRFSGRIATLLSAAAFLTFAFCSPAAASALLSFTPAANCSGGSVGNAPPFALGGCAIDSTGIPVNGVTGVEFQGTAANDNMTVTGNGGVFGLYLNESGGTDGDAYTGLVPLSWDFTISSSTGQNLSWDLTVTFTGNLSSNHITVGNINSFSNASGSRIAGSTSFGGAQLAGSTITGYQIQLEVEVLTAVNGDTVTLHAPVDAIEIMAPPAPEPATLSLSGLALAGLGALRLRRRVSAAPPNHPPTT